MNHNKVSTCHVEYAATHRSCTVYVTMCVVPLDLTGFKDSRYSQFSFWCQVFTFLIHASSFPIYLFFLSNKKCCNFLVWQRCLKQFSSDPQEEEICRIICAFFLLTGVSHIYFHLIFYIC